MLLLQIVFLYTRHTVLVEGHEVNFNSIVFVCFCEQMYSHLPARISGCQDLLKATVVCKGRCAVRPNKLLMGQDEGTVGPHSTPQGHSRTTSTRMDHYLDFISQ